MTAQIAAYGRLVADPQLKTTSKGTQMAMASMAVPLPCSQADDGTAMMWLSVLAFGRQADALAKHHKGELVSVAGNMHVRPFKTGESDFINHGQPPAYYAKELPTDDPRHAGWPEKRSCQSL